MTKERGGDPCDEGERLTRRGVETIGDEGERMETHVTKVRG